MYSKVPVQSTARKLHRCTWCGQSILVGQTYHRWVTFDDGAFTSKMHGECLSARQIDCAEDDGEYIAYGGERPAAQEGGA